MGRMPCQVKGTQLHGLASGAKEGQESRGAQGGGGGGDHLHGREAEPGVENIETLIGLHVSQQRKGHGKCGKERVRGGGGGGGGVHLHG